MSDAEVDERPNKRLKRGENPEDDDDSDEDDDGEEEVIGKDGKKVKSKGGSSCHQCKSRRNFTALTYCTSNLDKKNKRCRKKFCGHCLKKFYKESTQAIADKGNWKCPSCRKICCCAACRRRKTKEIGKEESSPAHTSKPKKAASHKSTHQRERNTHANHHDGNDAPYHSSSREDEGYPPQHRRGDRSLLHSSHSPRLNGRNSGGLMTDSPVQHGMSNYDMMDDQRHHDGDEYSSDNQHSYSESDHDSDDTDGSDDEAALNAHASGSQHYLHDDDPSTSLPSSQFTTLLSTHIKSLAEESARSPNTPFARLYKQAQQTKIKKKIKAILLRPDIKKEKKVELIAALLAPLEEQSTHEMPTSQQQQQQQQQPHVSMQTGI